MALTLNLQKQRLQLQNYHPARKLWLKKRKSVSKNIIILFYKYIFLLAIYFQFLVSTERGPINKRIRKAKVAVTSKVLKRTKKSSPLKSIVKENSFISKKTDSEIREEFARIVKDKKLELSTKCFVLLHKISPPPLINPSSQPREKINSSTLKIDRASTQVTKSSTINHQVKTFFYLFKFFYNKNNK